jgi:hypothetical protein
MGHEILEKPKTKSVKPVTKKANKIKKKKAKK